MNTTKKLGQVGHIEGRFIAIAAMDFVGCDKILTGEILGGRERIVVIGGKLGDESAVVARQDNGEDMHAPLLSAIYVDFESAADAYLTRSNLVYQYANEAKGRGENLRHNDLRKAGRKLLDLSINLRSKAATGAPA